jgi:hypothetical protein
LAYSARGVNIAFPLGGIRQTSDRNSLEGATVFYGPDPIPDNLIVKWTTHDGVKRQRDLAVASHIPDIKTWAGTIWLRFDYDTVECIPESTKEAYDRAMKVSMEEHRLGLDSDAVPATGNEKYQPPP